MCIKYIKLHYLWGIIYIGEDNFMFWTHSPWTCAPALSCSSHIKQSLTLVTAENKFNLPFKRPLKGCFCTKIFPGAFWLSLKWRPLVCILPHGDSRCVFTGRLQRFHSYRTRGLTFNTPRRPLISISTTRKKCSRPGLQKAERH